MNKEKLINWICDFYITNIKEQDWDQEDWHYLIEKAFKLDSMTIKQLKNFKTELSD